MIAVPVWVVVVYIIGLILVQLTNYFSHDAIMHVDCTMPDKDRYRFEVEIPLNEMEEKNYIRVKICREKN